MARLKRGRIQAKRKNPNMNTIFEPNPMMFQALDVTRDAKFMPRAQRMVASGYHALTAPESGLTTESVYEMLCADEYGHNHRAHTLAIITQPVDDAPARISGCARVVISPGGVSDSVPALDAMNFVVPLSGWPHEQSGIPQPAAEIGRFVIDAQFRTPEMRSNDVPQQITRAIYQGALDIIRPLGITCLYAIMPGYASRLLLQAGIELEELPCRLRMDDPEACRIFNLFPFYWKRSEPKLYRFVRT
jgi:hypothetical protein